MTETAGELIALLRTAVNGEVWTPQSEPRWMDLLRLARYHRLESALYYSLRDRPDVPEKVCNALEAAHRLAVFQDVQQDHTAAAIGNVLIAAKVPHILLRGARLKHDYPFPDMRVMSDLDYLVRVDDYPAIRQAMEGMGGRHIHTDGGHFSFVLPPQVMVEFHPNLIYVASPIGTAINPGWQYTRPGSGPYAQELTEEGFYLNMLCHLAYHFAAGGTGVRSVLDVWVYRRHRPQPDGAIVRQELDRAGMLEFAQQIEALAERWFGAGRIGDGLEELEEYILTSGVYGTVNRAVLNAASFSGGGSGGSALLSRAFYPKEELENRFPWTRGRPWLLPMAWCIRAVRAVALHRGHILRWGEIATDVTKKDVIAQRALLKRFGLKLK